MTTLQTLRDRLNEVAAASTSAEAFNTGRVDCLPPELARLAGALDVVVDPLGTPAFRQG
jgi:hypothetical protein